jgi:hypothetical protein
VDGAAGGAVAAQTVVENPEEHAVADQTRGGGVLHADGELAEGVTSASSDLLL